MNTSGQRQSRRFTVVPDGAKTLLTLLNAQGADIQAPCGGLGVCGKCIVRILSGYAGEPESAERVLLSAQQLSQGFRLACRTAVHEPLEVEVPHSGAETAGKGRLRVRGSRGSGGGWTEKRAVLLDEPQLGSRESELARLRRVIPGLSAQVDPAAVAELAAALTVGRTVTAVTAAGEAGQQQLLGCEAGDTSGILLGCAVDIGTTTVAVYLADVRRQTVIGSLSQANRQGRFGADVISRIDQFSREGGTELTSLVRTQVRTMIETLCSRCSAEPRQVYSVVCVGNPAMLHLFIGADPSGIALAPFTPVFTEQLLFPARTFGLGVSPAAAVCLLPGVSAYIGSDITAGIFSSGMDEEEGPVMLIDIGTNGEMVLTRGDAYWTCSTAAGPAFEGARIHCGCGGEAGAVDSFFLDEEGNCLFTTIGGEAPTCICGAGLVDIAAALLRAGIVDRRGKLRGFSEWSEHAAAPDEYKRRLSSRWTEYQGKAAWTVVPETGIIITQKDIRELQLAKAAIAAGIEILLKEAGIEPELLQKLYIAGGLGSSIRRESAASIGLFPAGLLERTAALGSSAGSGAVSALLDPGSFSQSYFRCSAAAYIELSARPDFSRIFAQSMFFPPQEPEATPA
jgi:uncharacterized 2Fe-2S/4Fe-4S cluster protein (DUF4445 family)